MLRPKHDSPLLASTSDLRSRRRAIARVDACEQGIVLIAEIAALNGPATGRARQRREARGLLGLNLRPASRMPAELFRLASESASGLVRDPARRELFANSIASYRNPFAHISLYGRGNLGLWVRLLTRLHFMASSEPQTGHETTARSW